MPALVILDHTKQIKYITQYDYTNQINCMSSTRDSLAALSFPQRQRLQYIESVALWEGSIARQRVCDLFDVSPNHITKDLRLYRDLLPHNLDYDPSSRTWRPSTRFRPAISSGSPDEYLGLLRLGLEASGVVGVPALEEGVPVAAVAAPRWPADAKPLRYVTRAAREGTGVWVRYQSMSSPQPEERILWPHALVYAGFRWHVRAYDERHQRFGDFVLSRICEAAPRDVVPPVPADEDAAWTTQQRAEVIPNTRLTKAQQAAIAREYGMTKTSHGWSWIVTMRQCLVPYFLYWHRLDNPQAGARVIVRNLADLKPYAFADLDD